MYSIIQGDAKTLGLLIALLGDDSSSSSSNSVSNSSVAASSSSSSSSSSGFWLRNGDKETEDMIAAEVKQALSEFVDRKVMKADKSPKELKKLNHLHKNLQGNFDKFFN